MYQYKDLPFYFARILFEDSFSGSFGIQGNDLKYASNITLRHQLQ